MGRKCTFDKPRRSEQRDTDTVIDLSGLLEEAVLQLRKDVPLELVVDMFQKMVLIFCSRRNPTLLTYANLVFSTRTFGISYSRKKAISWAW